MSSISFKSDVSMIVLYRNRDLNLRFVSCLTIFAAAFLSSSDSSSLGSTCFRLSTPINSLLSIRFLGWKPSNSFTNAVLPFK